MSTSDLETTGAWYTLLAGRADEHHRVLVTMGEAEALRQHLRRTSVGSTALDALQSMHEADPDMVMHWCGLELRLARRE